jgi:hypothetical protein
LAVFEFPLERVEIAVERFLEEEEDGCMDEGDVDICEFRVVHIGV